MPVLPAAGYDYKAYPTQTPSQEGAPYENIQAPASAFGATQGAALERLGAAGEQAGTRLADIAIARQNQFNLVVANNGTNQAQEDINKLLRGDPDVPGDAGYYGLHGDQAMRARPVVQKKMDDIIDGIRKGMQNPVQVLHFDQETRRFRNFAVSDIGQHYDREFDRYATETATAKMKLAGDAVAVAANNGDLSRMNEALQIGLEGIHSSLVTRGAPPEDIEAATKSFAKESVEKWVRARAVDDPLGAKKFAMQHKPELGDRYDDMMRLVAAGAEKAQTIEDMARIRNGASADAKAGGLIADAGDKAADAVVNGTPAFGKPPPGEPLPDASLWNRVKATEGGVGPQGAALTSPKGAVGISQIKPETARDMAKVVGLPFDEKRLASDPAYNELLGKTYLDKMVETYNGDQTLALAAYNAGPGKVNQWLKDIGDPRTGAISSAEFVRRIPVAETRDYIGKVLGSGAPGMALPPYEPGEAPDAEIPGLSQRIAVASQLAQKEGWTPQHFINIVKGFRAEDNANYANQHNAVRMKAEADKANDEAIKMEYHNRMGKNSQNVPTTDEVETDKRIRLSDTKKDLTGYIERRTKPNPMSQISAKNRMELFRRINLPDDDPEKIRSEDDINKAYINSLISDNDHEKTIKDLERAQGATTKDLETRKNRLLKAIGPKISIYLIGRTHDKALEYDPSIAEKETAWLNAVEDKIRDYKTTAGKNPRDLFSLKNPDYVGSDDFLHSVGIGMTMGDRMATPPTKPNPFSESYPAAPATPPPDLSTKESIQKAYQLGVQGKPGGITRLQAIEAARAIGVLKDSPVPMQ